MSNLSDLVRRLEEELGPAGGPPVPLSGGITNRNYRLRLGGRDCVLRLPGQDTGLLGIDRVSERLAAERAASLGIGPQLLHADAECMVTEFMPGSTLDSERLRADPSQVAHALRAFHDSGLELPARFWIPDLLRVYADTVRERGGTLPGAFLRAQVLVDRIASVLPLTGPVPCHNDLLPGNLIQTDANVLLVDWEYSGSGHRYFDLGNLAVNNAFDDAAEARLLEAYFGEPAALCRLSALRLFRLVSDAREGAWGVVQGLISGLDFDFTAYADEHFGRLERAAADPRHIEELLNAATRELPDRARIVIIGGGVGGTSIAYHLAHLGERDVILLDRNELTSGSTFHSAGLVGQLRGSVSLTRMMMDSVALYRTLDCGWVECGGVRLACTPEREQEVLRQVAWARTFGLPLELIGADDARDLFPMMVSDGVRCASYLPTDGYLDPSQLTYALAEGAREGGVQIFTHTRVKGIDVVDGRVQGVQTEWGPVQAEVVVNAGGMYAAEIGRLAGVRVPIVPFAHEYLVTQPCRERERSAEGEIVHLPTLRDPDLLIYFREEGAGLVMGGYERASAPWSLDGDHVDRIPADFNGRLLEEDWSRFEEIAENSRRRVPLMEDVKVTRLINGPEAFTPDNEFCLGESDVRGLFVAAGFCAHGLAGAGGMGKLMAEWILAGEPGLDVWEMDIRRFGPQYRSPSYTLKRTREVYETYYDIRYPGHERLAGRPLRLPPAYAWHAEHGAVFGEKSGWERVNWYECNAADGDPDLRPRGWAGMHWSAAIGTEALGTRERAGLFDESSFSKLELSGPGAAELLERLCDNRVARDVGQITYTQMLNRHGGIECDFTVARVAPELFQIVTGTAFGQHDAAWIRRHLPEDGSARLIDVTSRWACFGLWGPRAKDILAPLTPDPLDFGYMRMRELTVGDVPVRALRVTYVGEFGWELYCPSEYGLGLWQTLWDSGEPHGLIAGGYRAIESLRLEKGYRAWASDITADDSPSEAGLDFCVSGDKDFNGADALRERPVGRRLRCITLADPRSVALGNEPVRVGGQVVGRVTSAGYGYAVDRSIAYAYLPPEVEVGTPVELDIFGEWVAGEVAAEPLYDPEGTRLRH